MKNDSDTQDMFREKILMLLNENFKTVEVEKHPRATLNFLISEHVKRIHGENLDKRISQSTQKKVHKKVLKELKKRYGDMLTVRIRNLKHWEWDTNLGNVYSTNQGRLFGTYFYPDLFMTSHCIERWKERSFFSYYRFFSKAFKKRYYADPSPIDILLFLIQFSVQVGVAFGNPDFRYLNVNGGLIVLQIMDGIMVTKTFLTHNMAPKARWYSLPTDSFLNNLESLIDPKDDQEDKKMERNSIIIPSEFCYWYFKKGI